MSKKDKLSGHFMVHFVGILWLIIREKKSNFANIAFLLMLTVLEEVTIFQVGLITAKFYYILLLRDVTKFKYQLLITAGLIVMMAVIKSAKQYVSSVLYIEWRESISKLLISNYFKNLNYYNLNKYPSGGADRRLVLEEGTPAFDNVDQRLCHDVDKLCSELSQIMSQVVISPLTILYYAYQVKITIGLFGVLACLASFACSTYANRFMIRPIVKWTYLKGQHEGDYRTEHANVQRQCENIAFSNGEDKTKIQLLGSLNILLSVHENLILKQFYLNIATTIFDYSGSLLSFVIIAVPIFNGMFNQLSEAELSRQISTNAFICLYLINCFSKIVGISSNFASINGFGYRITELVSAFKKSSNYELRSKNNVINNTGDDQVYLRIDNSNIAAMNLYDPVLGRLNFEIRKGVNLYISGNSMPEKTAILKLIKGLYPSHLGMVSTSLDVNDMQQVMFISHDSIIAALYLRDLLDDDCQRRRSKIITYLKKYSLGFILDPNDDRLKTKINSSTLNCLSPAQNQIVNFLLMLCVEPKLAFLNDATNFLSDQTCDSLYSDCAQCDITLVTISNNDNLKKFHSSFLNLNQFKDVPMPVIN